MMSPLLFGKAVERATRRAFPLKHVDGNLLFDVNGRVGAIYQLSTMSYPFAPLDEKIALFDVMESLPNALQADFSIWRVNRMYPADRYVERAMTVFDSRFGNRQAWDKSLEKHRDRLEALGSHIPEVYLVVHLPIDMSETLALRERPPGTVGIKEGLWEGIRGEMGRFEKAFDVHRRMPMTKSAFAIAREVEKDRFGMLRDRLGTHGVSRADTHQIQWLLQRQMCRGVCEPQIDRYWEPDAIEVVDGDDVVYEPVTALLEQFTEHEMTAERNYLRVVYNEETVCYQAMISMGSLPKQATFPSSRVELLFAPLDRLIFPVDAVLHLQYHSNRKALKDAEKQLVSQHAVAQEEQQKSYAGLSPETREQYQDLQDYKRHLRKENSPPKLLGKPLFAVGASSYELLTERFRQLEDTFGDVQLHRGHWSQRDMFYEHCLRVGAGMHDFDEVMSDEQFAALMPVASHHVGSRCGPYLGYTTTTRRPVIFDVTEAARTDEPTAILDAGKPGSGKTTGCQKICVDAHGRGSFVLAVDPKPDHAFHNVESLKGSLYQIEFSRDKRFHGSLDPMWVPPVEMREGMTITYLCEVLNADRRDPRCKTAMMEAINDAVEHEEWSLNAVVERLGSGSKIGRELADELSTISRFGIASLAFGDRQDTNDILQTDRSFVTVRTPALTLPDAKVSKENYTEGERLSVATMGLVVGFAMRMMYERRDRHKLWFFDEAHTAVASRESAAALERAIRMGRAMNTTILLATQRASDISRLKHLIGMMIQHAPSSEQDAADGIELLGRDRMDQAFIRRMMSANQKGLCWIKDIEGRVGEVQIDPLDLLDVFNTSAPKVGESQ